MCVSASGWKDDVIATPRENGCSGTRGACAPSSASELVRVSAPSRSESRGSTPVSFIACSSRWVPSAPAESTTSAAANSPVEVDTRQPPPTGAQRR